MKRITVLATLLITSVAFAGEELPGEKVSISPALFPKIYPAVWFCPDDASVTSLKEKTEKPPEKRYRIWIEPSDPEIAPAPFEGTMKGKQFISVGVGEDAYRKANIATPGKELRKLGISEISKKKPVFIYREGQNRWALMVLEYDKKEEKITFMWRRLKE